MSEPATSTTLGRRDRRRLQSQEEILDAALEVMAVNGVAALNLTQVAAKVGLRQPSVYQYFRSVVDVYDALFKRGMHQHLAALQEAVAHAGPGWAAARAISIATVRFSMQSPVMAQLLFSRAVPGFTPSANAYAPSIEAMGLLQATIADAVDAGQLHPRATSPSGVALFIAVTAGVASQQAANEPQADTSHRRSAQLIEEALDMYAAYYTPTSPTQWGD